MRILMLTRMPWGWLPVLSFVQACGTFIIAIANNASRAGDLSVQPLFWLGLLVILLPTSYRVLSTKASRRERIGLVVLLALSFYMVKVLHSPVAFTFSDELIHLYNVTAVQQNHHLFHDNSILPITPLYPGLHIATAALAHLSGLSPFGAGVVVIGVARVMLLLALYLSLEVISGSGRVAGLATILYTANTNFLYWTAQFAYESLALPLAGVVLCAVVIRVTEDPRQRLSYNLVSIPIILAVVVTHHLTSYALAALLLLISVAYLLYSRGRQAGPWIIACFTLVTAAVWLLLVASTTVPYLSAVISGAVSSIFRLTVGEETTRELFNSPASAASQSIVTPVWERLVAFASVGLLTIGAPVGLMAVWRRHRDNVLVLSLTVIALTYFPLQLLRLTIAGWEMSNRTSEFLFLGLSFILALGLIRLDRSLRFRGLYHLVVLVYIGVVFLGGVIGGWQPILRLGHPYLIDVGTHTVEPQGVVAAEWATTKIGPGNILVADQSNARLMLAYGGQQPYTGGKYGVRDLLLSPELNQGEREILNAVYVDYVVFDRRSISWNNMLGLYFDRRQNELLPAAAEAKFEGEPGVARLFDSGDIVIFDVRTVTGNATRQ